MLSQDRFNIPAYRTLKNLRAALAVLQGARLLSVLQQEQESTVSHDQTKRVSYLTALYARIHRELYCDWKEQVSVCHRPGVMLDSDKRMRFRIAIERLVLEEDCNQDSAIFDNNGFVMHCPDIAERLAGFYRVMREIKPFAYGNRFTLDFFMTALGNLPAFRAAYESGIDFRRLDSADMQVLHQQESQSRQLARAFSHALDPSRCHSLRNRPNAYGQWPQNIRFLQGIPFLSHTLDDGSACLVTVNGGLVPLNGMVVEQLLAGQHFADNPLSASEHVIGYLPGTEDLRAPGKTSIDAIPLREDGVAPLFGLDVHILTGLRPPSHGELLDLLRQCAGEGASLFQLAGNPELLERMLAATDGEPRQIRSVHIAYDRLSKINVLLENTLHALFEGKIPVVNPKLIMAMGGAGAGKTAVEEMARAQCGVNFVTASLDEFRKLSDLYRVLTAANHHSDDYVYIEPFANRLRDLVAQTARERGFNLLYDGTAIPYHTRYSTIIKQFKAAGFDTMIIGVDAFLVKPAGRERELSRKAVVDSVKERFAATGRALPWVVTIDKHIRAPRAFLNALQDSALNKLSLFANDGERDRHYLVAESFDFTGAEVDALHQRQLQGGLTGFFREAARWRTDSVLWRLAQGDAEGVDAWLRRNPAFSEDNVAYLVYPGGDSHKVLLVYHLRRMVDFVQKAQLNPNASGEEGLLHKPAAMAFHVDPRARHAWLTYLQDAENL